jgi:UDPglucose 6-dehydrogenase
MKIAIVGTGYVGLVTGTCFAETGNDVTCVDNQAAKIEALQRGQIPIYEPGLAELVTRNACQGRLHFTTDLAAAVRQARLVFLAVGTPQSDNGSADLTNLWRVVDDLAPHLSKNAIVVTKSTVPVGTNSAILQRLQERLGRDAHVASNPEFLKEGAALDDFTKPDRVVVGVRDPEVAEALHELYRPFLRTEKPFLVMSPESAEMTKYVANALLATKISFINEVANICQRLGADINDVRRGIGHDARIGFSFLFPGVGYGGSCFPKDVRALESTARAAGVEPLILTAIDAVNSRQKTVLIDRIIDELGADLTGKTIAVWGLSFKPRTDDIREAPALVTIERLLARGARIQAHDPVAMPNVRKHFEGHPGADRIAYCAKPSDALRDADALAILTEWQEFVHMELDAMRGLMRQPVVFDGRNLYEPDQMREAGFTYHSIGRASVRG